MCSELYQVAKGKKKYFFGITIGYFLGLGDALVKSNLLPSLVELANDDNMLVRSSAVSSVVLVTPYLNKRKFSFT